MKRPLPSRAGPAAAARLIIVQRIAADGREGQVPRGFVLRLRVVELCRCAGDITVLVEGLLSKDRARASARRSTTSRPPSPSRRRRAATSANLENTLTRRPSCEDRRARPDRCRPLPDAPAPGPTRPERSLFLTTTLPTLRDRAPPHRARPRRAAECRQAPCGCAILDISRPTLDRKIEAVIGGAEKEPRSANVGVAALAIAVIRSRGPQPLGRRAAPKRRDNLLFGALALSVRPVVRRQRARRPARPAPRSRSRARSSRSRWP